MQKGRHLKNALQIHSIEGWLPDAKTLEKLLELEEGLISVNEIEDWMSNQLEFLSTDAIEIKRTWGQQLIGRITGAISLENSYYDEKYKVMKNRLSIRSREVLSWAEGTMSSANMLRLFVEQDQGKHFTAEWTSELFLEVHLELFSSIYLWAGKARTVGLRSKDVEFSPVVKIEENLQAAARALNQFLLNSQDADLALFISLFLWAHPFREGNGRTVMTIVSLCDPSVDFFKVNRKKWYEISGESLKEKESPRPEIWFEILGIARGDL